MLKKIKQIRENGALDTAVTFAIVGVIFVAQGVALAPIA